MNAIAVFQGKLKGWVKLSETISNNVKIEVNVSGLSPGAHGFHIHEKGNLLDKCMKCKGHYNPHNKNHGGLMDKDRHVGDLGNIIANDKGVSKMIIYDNLVKLKGKYSVIGRSIVIHSNEDDLGKGTNKESLITGNAGSRLDCAVIGIN